VEPILPYALSYAAGAMIWVSEGIIFLSFLFGVPLMYVVNIAQIAFVFTRLLLMN
jgi:hypothetical protein